MADDWVAERLRGSVLTYEAGQWLPLMRGDVVSDDRYIKTLGNGRVQFRRGDETIALGGHTMVQILDRSGQQFTNVHQHYGQVAVEAEKRDLTHFAVVTPHLVTVVKGTIFTVYSGHANATVSVERGQVNVSDPDSGTNVDIAPGQGVSVDPYGRFDVTAQDGGALPVVHDAGGAAIGHEPNGVGHGPSPTNRAPFSRADENAVLGGNGKSADGNSNAGDVRSSQGGSSSSAGSPGDSHRDSNNGVEGNGNAHGNGGNGRGN